MPDAPMLGADGAAAGKVTLDERAFGARFHGPLVHQSVRAEQAARRRGTAATKTRGVVSGAPANRPAPALAGAGVGGKADDFSDI